MKKDFINLTNGLKVVDYIQDPHFIRIQSTACEQKRWEFILNDLSHDFLMYLSLGYTCVIYDFSEKRNIPRALWQGIQWIKFVLYKRWFDKDYIPIGRAKSMYNYFNQQYLLLNKKTKKRIDYFKKFLNTDKLYIEIKTGNIKEVLK